MSEMRTMREKDMRKVSAQQSVLQVLVKIITYAFLIIMTACMAMGWTAAV